MQIFRKFIQFARLENVHTKKISYKITQNIRMCSQQSIITAVGVSEDASMADRFMVQD